MRVTGIGGGIGAARLWVALRDHAPDVRLTAIVNTAEDVWMHGLRVCPDIDTTLYALSGRQDLERGWGVRDESWQCMQTLAQIQGPQWFNLGDRDLGVHLHRTGRLAAGVTLSTVTTELADAFGVGVRVLPMSDDEVTTMVRTADGAVMHYQEFLVRRHAHDEVASVELVSAPGRPAAPAPGVLDAIAEADLVVIAPSNPVASVDPVLSLPGVREAVTNRADTVVVVSPIVSGRPITSPGEAGRARSRAALLRCRGLPATAAGVARHHRGLAARFVLDCADSAEGEEIRGSGYRVDLAETLLHEGAAAADLVAVVLDRVS